MAIRFQCPRCNSIRSVHERMKGKQIRCPDCDSVVRIPEIVHEEGLATVVPLPVVAQPTPPLPSVMAPTISPQTRTVTPPSFAPKSRSEPNIPAKTRLKQSVVAPSKRDDEEESESLAFPKRELPTDDMDMTPMVDVTFLLLIFFMITASFTTEKSIQQKAAMSDQASNQPKPDDEKDSVRVLIDEFNAYTIIFPDGDEREATSKQELLAVLAMAELEGASEDASTMVVEAHEDSIHATVVSALDAGREKGFSQFQVTVVENFD